MAGTVRVGHNAEELTADCDTVMTLKDGSVLEQESVLENRELSEALRTEQRIQVRKLARSKGQTHSYDGEEEGKSCILAKYYDPLVDSPSRGFDLSEDGTATLPSQPVPTVTGGESLNVPKTVASEFASFRKHRKRPRNDPLQSLDSAPRASMQSAFQARQQKAAVAIAPVSLEEEEKELQMSLTRQLRAAQKRNAPEEVMQAPKKTIESGGTVFSAAKEFIEAVETEKERLEAKRLATAGFSLRDSASGMTSVVNISLPSEKLAAEIPSVPTAPVEEPPATRDPITEEMFMGRGLAECLQLLRQRAALKQEKRKHGRATDAKCEDASIESESGPQLEYRDRRGRLLFRKQAYRELCYSFHNEGPGKNKLERMQKRARREEQSAVTETSQGTATFRTQKDVMAKTKQAYLVVPTTK